MPGRRRPEGRGARPGRRAHRARRARRRAGRCGSPRCGACGARRQGRGRAGGGGTGLPGRGAARPRGAAVAVRRCRVLDEAAASLPARPAIATRAGRPEAARRPCRGGPARREDRLRPGRLERLRLLQRRALRGLRRGRERRDRARRPLRRGRRGVRPQPAGGRLQPRRQGSGRAGAAVPAAQAGDPRPGHGRRRAARHGAASCAQRGETVVCVLPGDRGDEAGFDCDRELVRSPTGWMVQGRTEA